MFDSIILIFRLVQRFNSALVFVNVDIFRKTWVEMRLFFLDCQCKSYSQLLGNDEQTICSIS